MDEATAMAHLQVELDRPPFNLWLSPHPLGVDVQGGSIQLSLPFRDELGHDPAQPVFHGGVVAALADIAGHAVIAILVGRPVPTVTLQVDYLAPARGIALNAAASIRKLGRMLGRADVELTADGKLVALARGTFTTMETSR